MTEDSEIKIRPKLGKRKVILICTGLVLATSIAFEPVRHNDFVQYDDHQYLVQNPQVHKGVTQDSVTWAFTTFHVSNWHPLTWISHMIDYELCGLNPLWHHFVNVLFHIGNTLLLFMLFRWVTGAVWRSVIVSALFALHPVHVESVAWAAERKDVLSTFFWLLTMLAYVSFVNRPGIRRYTVIFVLFCLGLMAKPMLVTLPVVLLLFDFWPLGRFRFGGAETIGDETGDNNDVGFWRLILEKIPLFMAAGCSSVITILAQKRARGMADDEIFALLAKASNALCSYMAYIGKMLYPKDLAVLYPLQMEGLGFWKPLFAAAGLLLITLLVLYAGRKKGYLVLGWFWYVITLLPVIGLIQVGVQSMADRYTYVPSIGFFIVAVWGLGDLFEKFRISFLIRFVLAAGVLAVCVLATRVQVGHWRNSFTLFERAVKITENNYVMHNNFGAVLVSTGRYDEAIEQFEEVLRIKPGFTMVKYNIGHLLKKQNKVDEAIEYFKAALAEKEDWPDAYNELGQVYACRGEYELAIGCYKQAIELEPDNPDTYNNWGMALEAQDKADQAREKFNKAQELSHIGAGG